MEKKQLSRVEKTWQEKGQELIRPKILLAIDRSQKLYFITQDSSSIVFMVRNGTNTTFAIPKKYCLIDKKENIYRLQEIEKLIPVSCPRKNEYEIFVQKYLIQ